MAVAEIDEFDKRLLNLLQSEVPLVRRPFAEVGRQLALGEDEVVARLRALKEAGVVRQVSAIFDTRALGYHSSLVAMKVAPEGLDEAAAVVNSHPGVSHNYRRDHPFNLWFTIAVPPYGSLDRTIQKLHDMAGAVSTRLLPTLRLFKIGVKLDMTGEEDPAGTAEPCQNGGKQVQVDGSRLSTRHIAAIRELQRDIDVVPAPFEAMAERAGLAEEELLDMARGFLETGRMRRFAAVLYHRKAGFKANGMVVWAVPEDRVEEVGARVATFNAVSHCYQRPSYPDWPYNLFAMVHGRSGEECEAVAGTISEATGLRDHIILYSTREYKKVRVLLYTPEFDRWEARYLGANGFHG